MSADLVPGRILLEADTSDIIVIRDPACCEAPGLGDTGFVWSSAMGGGLGRRGELDGELGGRPVMLWRKREKEREEQGR